MGTPLEQSGLLAMLVYNGTALAVAMMLYLLVERPVLRLRDAPCSR